MASSQIDYTSQESKEISIYFTLCAIQFCTISPPFPTATLYPRILSKMKSSCAAPCSTTSSVRGCASLSFLPTDSMLSIKISPLPPQTRMSLTTLSRPLNQAESARYGWFHLSMGEGPGQALIKHPNSRGMIP